MNSGSAPVATLEAVELIGEALHHGLDYWGHELDDVSAQAVAITLEAKRYESALVALEHLSKKTISLEAILIEAKSAFGYIAQSLELRDSTDEAISHARFHAERIFHELEQWKPPRELRDE